MIFEWLLFAVFEFFLLCLIHFLLSPSIEPSSKDSQCRDQIMEFFRYWFDVFINWIDLSTFLLNDNNDANNSKSIISYDSLGVRKQSD